MTLSRLFPPGHRFRRAVAALAATAITATGLTLGSAFTATSAGATIPGDKDTTALMFQWTWDAIADECTSTLGPAGYGYVLTSPPQEHVLGSQWWTSYQPVSYRIESKLGTRAEFAAMVSTCHDAGVKVLADAVINHMSGQSAGGTGWAGTAFQHYAYPGPAGGYGPQDFNDCRRDIQTYQDRWEVQHCNLVNLADLRTSSGYVRQEIADYLDDLLSLGVDGFRIDAAKHMPAEDVAAIKGLLSDPDTYFVNEVIGAAGEPVRPSEYVGSGDVHEFDYARHLKRMFTSDRLAYLSTFGQSWGMLPSHQAGVFVDNHDTERNGETLSYKDGARYTLANVFMLAWPYGSPAVTSSYAFTGHDQGPPQNADGSVRDAVCYSEGWNCQHAWPEIAGMVGFRNAAGDAAVTGWWDNGNDQIAFGRGSAAYVAINGEGGTLQRTFQTSLPAGTYCDVTQGRPTATGCSGGTVTVDGSGRFAANVGSNDAVAIHVGALAGGGNGPDPDPVEPGDTAPVSFGVTASTSWGQNIFVVGSIPALGSWSPAAAAPLSAATYPVWRSTLDLPAGTTFEYKYVRKDGAGNVTWESGANRTATVGSSGTVTLNDTWRS
ncbi:carbohydrate-binding module family 20 domain-containing protein [Oerskovia flava]|uniref:carbohydrate-binding module family 20 domain-containing protein n=1 Tax=Oerskovia flava TaxID=2986422 RepID=UPI00223EF976|nr:carbohydrate-binding module family 20 domain-containing protein [Oerskovia sp. JB1-3-2]